MAKLLHSFAGLYSPILSGPNLRLSPSTQHSNLFVQESPCSWTQSNDKLDFFPPNASLPRGWNEPHTYKLAEHRAVVHWSRLRAAVAQAGQLPRSGSWTPPLPGGGAHDLRPEADKEEERALGGQAERSTAQRAAEGGVERRGSAGEGTASDPSEAPRDWWKTRKNRKGKDRWPQTLFCLWVISVRHLFFNYSIIALRCCVNFCCTTM